MQSIDWSNGGLFLFRRASGVIVLRADCVKNKDRSRGLVDGVKLIETALSGLKRYLRSDSWKSLARGGSI